MEYRQCQKCGVTKPIDEFTKEPMIKSGRKWKCKTCEAEDEAMYVKATRRFYEQRT